MKVESAAPSKHVKGRWLITLEGGSLLKVTENEVMSFALTPGRELTPQELAALKEAGSLSDAKSLAAKLLGEKPRSRKELLDKLKEKGIEDRFALAAADRMEELGVLDDLAYARTAAAYYSRKGYGEKKLRDELYKRGVPRELWDEALAAAEPPEDGIDRFLRAKLGPESDEKTKQRAVNALLRRGYSWSEVREGLERIGESAEEY